MEQNAVTPRKALNKAYLKVKPTREEIETFKTNLNVLLTGITENESEEHHKNLIGDFLKQTWYQPDYHINTKGRKDLVIHNGKTARNPVGVIWEVKKPGSRSDMVRKDRLNAKALHELLLYYLRERISEKNTELKHLVITDVYEWFIFDATLFEKMFAKNKELVRLFQDFEAGRLSGNTTDFFYNNIAHPHIEKVADELSFAWFDLRSFEKPLKSQDKTGDRKLITLYKILSPQHLLKRPFLNDSNTLDRDFYVELLHILGLKEHKDSGKRLISRPEKSKRHSGSFIENTIIQLDYGDKITRMSNPKKYGDTYQEQLFNVAMELTITWLNRILFLKLLEAQIIKYRNDDPSYAFLNLKQVHNFDDLTSLFFGVLARIPDERPPDLQARFANVPYLNSSLFEPTEIEHETFFIAQLSDEKTMPLHSNTILKDTKGKKRSGEMPALEYLFEFLNAYDFSSEGAEDIQEESKTLINASVLGLVFEKINGYRDGSFFTPGFVTMYMCRETIRRAVVDKFKEAASAQLESLNDVYEHIGSNRTFSRQQANEIINSIKICDPAVGSGHFLVSALNEMLALKSELNVLMDDNGRTLRDYHIVVENDELIITDENGQLFTYHSEHPESQRVQETLFHEKQTIIENCLFGVDINPNSVKICRLRLWIELLKNAYYIQNNKTAAKTSTPLDGKSTESFHQIGGKAANSSSPDKGRWQPKADGGFRLHNLPHLKTFRKTLRKNLTPAEAKLWTLLKGKALDGRKFRRQHSVANYILDFYCPAERLAIELDGPYHLEATQAELDYERDLFLNAVGIRVLRVENQLIWDEPEWVLDEIKSYFGKQKDVDFDAEINDSGAIDAPPRQSPTVTPPHKGGELSGMYLQTLPNLDINIKAGNSLVSRFTLDADVTRALKKSKWTIDAYRTAVQTYREAQNKEQKREMERLIRDIKGDFRTEISKNDPKVRRLDKLSGELWQLLNQQQMFELTAKEKTARKKRVEKLESEISRLTKEIEEIKSNRIFENAFEWRFEFPEVLDENGSFTGFDVILGNPPYIRQEALGDMKPYLQQNYQVYQGTADIYNYFIELGMRLLRPGGHFHYIVANKWMRANYGKALREWLQEQTCVDAIYDFGDLPVFAEATTYPCLLQLSKKEPHDTFLAANIEHLDFENLDNYLHEIRFPVDQARLQPEGWALIDVDSQLLLEKIRSRGIPLSEYVDGRIYRGVLTGLNEAFVINEETKNRLISEDEKSAEIIKPFLRGRDIKRYKQPEAEQFVIFTRRGIDIEHYPAILNYLTAFKEKLEPRPKNVPSKNWKGRKPGSYKWYELQDTIYYYEEFEKPKIIVPAIVKSANYVFDSNSNYSNDKTTIIPTDDKYLLGILNSSIADFYISQTSSTKQGGFYEHKPMYVSQIPIPEPDGDLSVQIEEKVSQILEAKTTGNEELSNKLDKEIDDLVSRVYGV